MGCSPGSMLGIRHQERSAKFFVTGGALGMSEGRGHCVDSSGQWWFLWAGLVGQGFWHIVAGLGSGLEFLT